MASVCGFSSCLWDGWDSAGAACSLFSDTACRVPTLFLFPQRLPHELLYHLHLAGCEYAFIVFCWCPVSQIILLSYSSL